jgi:hypothetical protein
MAVSGINMIHLEYILVKVWVLILLWTYGLWGTGGSLDFPANEVGGNPKPMGYDRSWVIGGMKLGQV